VRLEGYRDILYERYEMGVERIKDREQALDKIDVWWRAKCSVG
jgi:hypothetical protein